MNVFFIDGSQRIFIWNQYWNEMEIEKISSSEGKNKRTIFTNYIERHQKNVLSKIAKLITFFGHFGPKNH